MNAASPRGTRGASPQIQTPLRKAGHITRSAARFPAYIVVTTSEWIDGVSISIEFSRRGLGWRGDK